MFANDQAFDPKLVLGPCDLITCFTDFAYILIFLYFFQIMNEYDQTFDPKVLIGHYVLISWFCDFAFLSQHSMGI